MAQRVAAFLTYGLVLWPRATRLVASAFAMITLADFLHPAYAATIERITPPERREEQAEQQAQEQASRQGKGKAAWPSPKPTRRPMQHPTPVGRGGGTLIIANVGRDYP